MTASFHKYGDFFPGTGALGDKGKGKGKGYAVNFPFKDGIDDESYGSVFRPVCSLFAFFSLIDVLSIGRQYTGYASYYGLV